VGTILIGVDDSSRSEDAVAFAGRLAAGSPSRVVVACAFPYSDLPSRSANLSFRAALKAQAERTARRMAESLSNVPEERIEVATKANPSTAHALHDLAEEKHAALIVVGSTHTSRAGRVFPGATAERLLHGAPCAVAIVPDGYRTHGHGPIRRIGVAYDGSAEAGGALDAATAAAAALDAQLEIIGVVAVEDYGSPALYSGPSYDTMRRDVEAHVEATLEGAASSLPGATAVRLSGDPAQELCAHSRELDLLVVGSRGYGPLRAVMVGGVSGRVLRDAQCPVVVVPRGVESPLGELFGRRAAAGRRG
jgi:nucleotide-binding universal stress UspA family protein